jgi:hypothetical protein
MTSIFEKPILHVTVIQIRVFNLPNVLSPFPWLPGSAFTSRVGPLLGIVTLLSAVIAHSISLVFGASMGKIANLSTFETCHGAYVVIRYCLFGCIYLLRMANIILGITLSLSR